MNERIKEIAKQSSDFAEQIPYFHGIKNGLTWEGAIQKARDLKFAELIVRECLLAISKTDVTLEEMPVLVKCHDQVEKHFGIE